MNRKIWEYVRMIAVIALLIVVSMLIVAFLAPLFRLSLDLWLQALYSMFGQKTVAFILGYFLLALFLSAIYFVLMRLCSDKNKPFRTWFHLTLCVIGIILFVGVISINLIVTLPNLDSVVLRDIDDTDKIVGEIDCKSVSKDFVEGRIITCEITKPELSEFNSTVVLTNVYGNETEFKAQNSIEFLALKETNEVYFKIRGISDGKKVYNLHITRSFEFTTLSQSSENKDKRLAYVIGLFGIVLFSVPNAMVALRNLWRNKP